MKLREAMMFEGEAHSMARRHHAVVTHDMAKHGGHTRPTFKEGEHKGFGGKHTGPSPSLLPGGGGHGHKGRYGGHGVRKAGVGHHAHGRMGRHHSVAADASPSDLASHHVYNEPSSTDATILQWRQKRLRERALGRNMEPFEVGAMASRPVTGPCGCTLAIGDSVVVEGIGRGRVTHRRDRMLRVALDRGGIRVIDQKFVHQLRTVRRG